MAQHTCLCHHQMLQRCLSWSHCQADSPKPVTSAGAARSVVVVEEDAVDSVGCLLPAISQEYCEQGIADAQFDTELEIDHRV